MKRITFICIISALFTTPVSFACNEAANTSVSYSQNNNSAEQTLMLERQRDEDPYKRPPLGDDGPGDDEE